MMRRNRQAPSKWGQPEEQTGILHTTSNTLKLLVSLILSQEIRECPLITGGEGLTNSLPSKLQQRHEPDHWWYLCGRVRARFGLARGVRVFTSMLTSVSTCFLHCYRGPQSDWTLRPQVQPLGLSLLCCHWLRKSTISCYLMFNLNTSAVFCLFCVDFLLW